MIAAETPFLILGVVIIGGAILGWRLYHTVLNPLTYVSIINTGVNSLLSGCVCLALLEFKPYAEDVLSKTTFITLVNYVGLIIPYLFKRTWLTRLYGMALRLLRLDSDRIAGNFRPLTFIALLVGMFTSFLALAILGGGGLRWITDPRETYLYNRVGVGPFYLSMQWFLVSALLYYLWACRPKGPRLALLLIIFAGLSYFSGSKGNILNIGLLCVIYFNYYIRPILFVEYFFLVLLFALCFSCLLIIQHSTLSIFAYFSDYFNTTALFISRFEEFGFQYGRARLENLWFYVPRGLYHEKPYEYGVLLIHQTLFPNMAERGATPGFLSWTMSYLDFGLFGVFVNGLMISIWQRTVYEYYLSHRESLFSFIFMIHFALFQLYLGATAIIILILALLLSFHFRLIVKSGKSRIV